MEPGLSGRAARLLLGVAILTALVALRFNRIFLTFGAASNRRLRTNLFESTTWMLFGKSRKVDLLKSRKFIDSSRLLPLSAPKVRKIRFRGSSALSMQLQTSKTQNSLCQSTTWKPIGKNREVDCLLPA
jgi:hypothetical protein